MTPNRARVRPRRRALAPLTAAGLAAVALAAAPAGAQAASTAGAAVPTAHFQLSQRIATRYTYTIPAGTHAFSAPGGAFRVVTSPSVSPHTSISCTLTIGTPVYEGSLYGVYGTASVSCTAAVQELYIITALFYDGSEVAETYGETSPGFSSVSKTTSYNGPDGTYQTGADAEIWYPAGYSPSTGTVGPSYSLGVTLP